MSDQIRQFKEEVDRLGLEIEKLKNKEPKHIILKIILKGISNLLGIAAPVIATEHKILAVIFTALSKTINFYLK
jgi:hypothetical protein